jgi:predicted nucleic acid-binding protein
LLLAWLRNKQRAADTSGIACSGVKKGTQLSMSSINAGEVYYVLSRKHNAKIAEEFLARLPSMPIRVVLPEEADIIAAAKLKSTRKISYADGFAAALPAKESAALITGDPELRAMASVIIIEWIGPQPAG